MPLPEVSDEAVPLALLVVAPVLDDETVEAALPPAVESVAVEGVAAVPPEPAEVSALTSA